MLNKLEFKTQNNERIDTSKCVPVGNFSAAFCDMLTTFGLPRIGGEREDQIQWDVRFSDGCVVTLYNWAGEPESVTNWFVGSTSPRCLERIATLISLRKEVGETAINDLMETIAGMMRGIEDRHGSRFATMVAVGRLSYKLISLIYLLLDEANIPEDVREATRDAATDMSARIVAHAAQLSSVIKTDEDMAAMTDYVTDMEGAEQRMAAAVVRSASGVRH